MIKNEKCFFTIIIKDADNLLALDVLKRQNWIDFECIIANSYIQNLEKYIANDKRFRIIESASDDKYQNVNIAIEHGVGKYFIILNSDDILIPNSLENIYKIVISTDAQIVKYNTIMTKDLSGLSLDEQKFTFNYLIRRNLIMQSMFDNLSGFCFARDIIQSNNIYSPEHLFIMNILKNAVSIAKTGNVYLLQSKEHVKITVDEYVKVIDNFKNTKDEFSDNFWRDYFKKIIPETVIKTVSDKRRDVFVYCCKNIPLRFIPLKYKFMFFIMGLISRDGDA